MPVDNDTVQAVGEMLNSPDQVALVVNFRKDRVDARGVADLLWLLAHMPEIENMLLAEVPPDGMVDTRHPLPTPQPRESRLRTLFVDLDD